MGVELEENFNRIGPKPGDLITALSEGIMGYLLYQSRCGIYPAYSEYLIYDPMVRISKNLNWIVNTEVKLDDKPRTGGGDYERIDFLFKSSYGPKKQLAIEVKYLKKKKAKVDIENDCDKLNRFRKLKGYEDLQGYVLIAGNFSSYNQRQMKVAENTYELSEQASAYFNAQRDHHYGVKIFSLWD